MEYLYKKIKMIMLKQEKNAQDTFKKKNIEIKLVKKNASLQNANVLKIKDRMKLINNYMNLLSNNILRQVKNYLIFQNLVIQHIENGIQVHIIEIAKVI